MAHSPALSSVVSRSSLPSLSQGYNKSSCISSPLVPGRLIRQQSRPTAHYTRSAPRMLLHLLGMRAQDNTVANIPPGRELPKRPSQTPLTQKILRRIWPQYSFSPPRAGLFPSFKHIHNIANLAKLGSHARGHRGHRLEGLMNANKIVVEIKV